MAEKYIVHNNQVIVFAGNSDETTEGRYFLKAVAVIPYSPKVSIYHTDDEAISNAGPVSNYDILAKHSSCRCWHCAC